MRAKGMSDMAGKAARVCGRAQREAAEIQRVHRQRGEVSIVSSDPLSLAFPQSAVRFKPGGFQMSQRLF